MTSKTLTLVAFLFTTQAAVAGPAVPPTRAGSECASKDEVYLLNHRVTLPPLTVWDAPKQEWRGAVGTEADGPVAKIRIVHLWGTWCQPCKEEFPVLKQMDLQIRNDYKGEAQFVYVADALSSSSAMRTFMQTYGAAMPVGLLYHDDENKLGSDLLSVLPQKAAMEGRMESASERQLMLPVTLLLDESNVVRMAFVGSLMSRRAELVNGIAQLHRTLSGTGAPVRSKVAAKRSRSL